MITLDWNYDRNYINVSMPRYFDKALQKFQHPQPKQPQHDLHHWTVSAYGSKSQYDQDVLIQLHLDPYGKQ